MSIRHYHIHGARKASLSPVSEVMRLPLGHAGTPNPLPVSDRVHVSLSAAITSVHWFAISYRFPRICLRKLAVPTARRVAPFPDQPDVFTPVPKDVIHRPVRPATLWLRPSVTVDSTSWFTSATSIMMKRDRSRRSSSEEKSYGAAVIDAWRM